MPVHLFVSLDYPWAERETARSVELLWTSVQDLTSEEEEDEHHDESVTKVQEGGGRASDCQLGAEEMNRVQEEINCRAATSQERPPPPVIILWWNKVWLNY